MSEPQLRPTCGPVSQPQLCKPFLTLNVLFVLMLFSGKFAIEMYAVDIFKHSQDSVDENTATVILGKGVDIYRDRHHIYISCLGGVHLLGSLLFLPIVKYFQRKVVLITSAAVMGVSLLVLGNLSFYDHDN